MAQSLEDKIIDFLNVWQVKVGDNSIKAVNDAVGYRNQTVDLQPVFDVRIDKNGVSWTLTYNKDYWQYIEHGVNGTENSQGSKFSFSNGGKRIPIKPLQGWIEKRGLRIQTKAGVKGKSKGLAIDKGRKSLAFAMSTSIKKKGIKPKPFVDNILTQELRDELKTGMAKIFGEEIIATFKTD